jgi:hypothetical protein
MDGVDDGGMRKRKKKKKNKKPAEIFYEPSDKDILMAKAYGGVPKAS